MWEAGCVAGHRNPTKRTFFPTGNLTTPEIDLGFQCKMGASRARFDCWSALQATTAHGDASDGIRQTQVMAMYPMIAPEIATAAFEVACMLCTAVAMLMCYLLGARC